MWIEGGPGFWSRLAARFVEIPGAGHVPQYEKPDAFRAALLDWLAAT